MCGSSPSASGNELVRARLPRNPVCLLYPMTQIPSAAYRRPPEEFGPQTYTICSSFLASGHRDPKPRWEWRLGSACLGVAMRGNLSPPVCSVASAASLRPQARHIWRHLSPYSPGGLWLPRDSRTHELGLKPSDRLCTQ